MADPRTAFVRRVQDFAHHAFEQNKHEQTSYEVEVATLCALISTMGALDCSPEHADKILEALQSFVLRLRNKNGGAVQRLLLRLADLHAERNA